MTRSAPGTQRLRRHCVEPRGNSHGHGQNELHDAMADHPRLPGCAAGPAVGLQQQPVGLLLPVGKDPPVLIGRPEWRSAAEVSVAHPVLPRWFFRLL